MELQWQKRKRKRKRKSKGQYINHFLCSACAFLQQMLTYSRLFFSFSGCQDLIEFSVYLNEMKTIALAGIPMQRNQDISGLALLKQCPSDARITYSSLFFHFSDSCSKYILTLIDKSSQEVPDACAFEFPTFLRNHKHLEREENVSTTKLPSLDVISPETRHLRMNLHGHGLDYQLWWSKKGPLSVPSSNLTA